MSPEDLAAARELGHKLPVVASEIASVLKAMTGSHTGFVLILHAHDTSQYISNCKREDGSRMIEEILMRWRANRADIGAHMNPELSQPPDKAVMVYPDRAAHYANACRAAIEIVAKRDPFLADELRKLRDTLRGA